MAEARVGRHGLAPIADMLVRGDDHRHLGGEPDTFAQRRRGRFIGGLGIKRRECRHRGAQHVHRVGAPDQSDHVVDLRGQRARGLQFRRECVELRARGQFALQQQVAGFLEGRMRGKLMDRIAAVTQLAVASVDIAHARAVEVQAFQAAMYFYFFGGFVHCGTFFVQRSKQSRFPAGDRYGEQ